MAKKKKLNSGQLTVGSVELREPEATEVPEEELGYTVGRWGWHDQYVCKTCQFDTLNLAVMEEHLMLVHGVFKLKEPITPPLPPPDGSGKDVEVADGIFEIDLKEDQ